MTHSYVWHDSFNVWHNWFICVCWFIDMCGRHIETLQRDCSCFVFHSYVSHDSFIYVTWLICTCDMIHSNAFDDLLIYVADIWRPPMTDRCCFTCHAYVSHNSFICSYVWLDLSVLVTWLIRTCYMTHSYVFRGPFMCVEDIYIRMCDITLSYAWPVGQTNVLWASPRS